MGSFAGWWRSDAGGSSVLGRRILVPPCLEKCFAASLVGLSSVGCAGKEDDDEDGGKGGVGEDREDGGEVEGVLEDTLGSLVPWLVGPVESPSCFFHFVRRFWNQILTWKNDKNG